MNSYKSWRAKFGEEGLSAPAVTCHNPAHFTLQQKSGPHQGREGIVQNTALHSFLSAVSGQPEKASTCEPSRASRAKSAPTHTESLAPTCALLLLS